MKFSLSLGILFLYSMSCLFAQNIGDFISVAPGSQDAMLHIPATHTFQFIIQHGDPLTAGGTLPDNTDFAGYVPINGRSDSAYLSINSERNPGGNTVLDIDLDTTLNQWQVLTSTAVDFTGVQGTRDNCSGTVTPWGTVITCEEEVVTTDVNMDGYFDIGWAVEIDPVTKTVINKRWAMGCFSHENAVVHSNRRTVYQGADSNPGYLFKFVADVAEDLSSGNLYVYSGSKSGAGNWLLLNNSTPTECSSTNVQAALLGATVFNGIEDVEIGPDGKVYFAVKAENVVYRFQDSDPISGTTVTQFETYVGNANYTINYGTGTAVANWGYGNDNLAFDGDGNLWVFQDGGDNHIWMVKAGHTQAMPQVEIFGRSPAGSEPTGITFSPDYKYMFISIQHPSSANSSSSQYDAFCNLQSFDRDVTLVIARDEHLGPNPSSGPCPGILPTSKLVSFEATQQENAIELEWAMSEYEKDLTFIIERGDSIGRFSFLASVPTTGQDSNLHIYSFTDLRPYQGKNTYRIKIVSADGSHSYSHVVEITPSLSPYILAFPNPVRSGGELNVSLTGISDSVHRGGVDQLERAIDIFDYGNIRSSPSQFQVTHPSLCTWHLFFESTGGESGVC